MAPRNTDFDDLEQEFEVYARSSSENYFIDCWKHKFISHKPISACTRYILNCLKKISLYIFQHNPSKLKNFMESSY